MGRGPGWVIVLWRPPSSRKAASDFIVIICIVFALSIRRINSLTIEIEQTSHETKEPHNLAHPLLEHMVRTPVDRSEAISHSCSANIDCSCSVSLPFLARSCPSLGVTWKGLKASSKFLLTANNEFAEPSIHRFGVIVYIITCNTLHYIYKCISESEIASERIRSIRFMELSICTREQLH